MNDFDDLLPPTSFKTGSTSNYAFAYLFYNCKKLASAPELPATTLVSSCYSYMFRNCRLLTSIQLHYEGIDTSFFSNWVSGITSTGTLNKAGEQFPTSGSNTYPATWTQVQI